MEYFRMEKIYFSLSTFFYFFWSPVFCIIPLVIFTHTNKSFLSLLKLEWTLLYSFSLFYDCFKILLFLVLSHLFCDFRLVFAFRLCKLLKRYGRFYVQFFLSVVVIYFYNNFRKWYIWNKSYIDNSNLQFYFHQHDFL